MIFGNSSKLGMPQGSFNFLDEFILDYHFFM